LHYSAGILGVLNHLFGTINKFTTKAVRLRGSRL
jgi:hypothetical protein